MQNSIAAICKIYISKLTHSLHIKNSAINYIKILFNISGQNYNKYAALQKAKH